MWTGNDSLEFRLLDAGQFHEMSLQSMLESSVPVNRHGNPYIGPLLGIDVVTASYSYEFPTVEFRQPAQSLATHGFHTAISMTLPLSGSWMEFTATERQPSTASYRLVSSSSKDSPWVAHPGMAGTSAQ